MKNFYKQYDERTPDGQYKLLLWEVLKYGKRTGSQQGVDAITLISPNSMRFDLENGFPVITERNIKSFWKQSIGEICGFVNGARTLKELEEFGCYWWKSWGTETKCKKRRLKTGDLGPGSYGAAFYNFPVNDGSGGFNQFKNLVEQIKELPNLRTHFITPWIPQYIGRGVGKIQKVVVAPCHGWIHVRILDNRLHLHMFQRSADVPVGVPANMIQYAALTMMLAQVTGYKPGEFIHSFSDAHIYVDQVPYVEEMIKRKTKRLPTVHMDENIKDLFRFRKEHFTMCDYKPGPEIKNIPVAI
jgi:thymidylate synthase